MEPSPDTSAHRKNLAELQAGSLRAAALLPGAFGYVWLTLLVWPEVQVARPPVAWLGCMLLLSGTTLAYLLAERRPRAGSLWLIGGILAGILGSMLTFRLPGLAYLFVIPVALSSLLLRQREVYLVAGVAALLHGALGVPGLGLSLSAGDAWLPIAVMGLIVITSWLSARNLYTALDWVWSGYEQAHRNEEMARAGQAELRRALKALDEATYRLERTNYQLAVARDQAEEARRLKQQFAQTISHELRTPLNLILGFTELMVESPEYYGSQLSPGHVRDLSIVHRNALHLRSLINDVLDLARIETAQMGLLLEQVDPATLVQEALETARSLVESRGLVLIAEVENGLPSLWLDPTRTRQVLFNLLSNAARFTEQGSITVRVRRQQEQVVFAVADTGPGIAEKDIPRIFEEFQQLDAGTRRHHDGAGLGLAISRRFVELHGGRIWVESQVGQGSTFYFSLPVQRVEMPAPAAAYEPLHPAPHPSQKPLLLAVTRSPAAAALLTHYVHSARTVTVPDLQQACTAAQRLRPHAVLVDGVSHPLDSASLARLAEEWGLTRVPFIACPLPGEEPLRQRLDVEGYLIKPVSRAAVWDALRPFGERVDHVLVIDDDEDFCLLLTRMLEGSPVRRYQVSCASSGLEGLAMAERRPPDLIFLDLKLPDIDGVQVLEHIRANCGHRNPPVIVVSAQDEMDGEQDLGGIMTVAKASGLQPREILSWVQSVVDSAVNPAGAPPVPAESPVPKPAFPETHLHRGIGPAPSA